ncbi:MAG: DUF3052 family protein [Gemmatimonadaceae bacterium]
MKRQTGGAFGYSGTPLVNKLGMKPGARLQFVSAPKDFAGLLGELPDGSRVAPRGRLDFAILFVKERSRLMKGIAPLCDRLEPNGTLWVAWPKKASGMETDLSEAVVRAFGLESGLVDVKVCAVDDTWSGLKFVRRLKDR